MRIYCDSVILIYYFVREKVSGTESGQEKVPGTESETESVPDSFSPSPRMLYQAAVPIFPPSARNNCRPATK
jgi:hypothetical protein